MFGTFRTNSAVVLLGLSFAVTMGCGNESKLPPGETGEVQGKVTYKASPVPAGWTIVFMHDETSQTGTGSIAPDGTFKLRMQGGTKILAGDYKVCLSPPPVGNTNEDAEAAMKRAMDGQADAGSVIPAEFQSYDTSEMTFDVKTGDNDASFELED